MPNLKNKTKFTGSSVVKNSGWLEKYGDGGETDPPFLEIKKPIIAEAESTGVAKPNITNIHLNEKKLDYGRETLNYMHALQLLKKHNVTVDSTGNILEDIGLPSSAYYNPITRTINYNPTEEDKRDYNFSLKKEYTDMIMRELPHAIQSDSLGALKFLKNTIKEGVLDVITNKLEKTGLNRYDENDKIEGHAHNVLEQRLIKERDKALGYDNFNHNLISSKLENKSKYVNTKKEYGGWLEQYQDGGDFNDYKRPGPVEDRSTGMTGMMKSKIATEAHYGNPSALRMVSPNPKTGMTPEGIGTHYMTSFDNYAVPLLQDKGGKNLEYIENPSISKEDIRFNSPEEAEYFAKHYKEVAPMMRNHEEYKNGGKTDQNPLLKSKTLLLEGNDENPQDLGPDANRSGFGINNKKIHINDNRKIRATTGKKINPNVALKTGDYDENVIDSLIKYAVKYNIEPNRVLAQGLAESTFGKKDSQNIGHLKHFYKNESPYPQMMEAILEGDRLAKTNKNKKTTREEIIQGYNGYGKLFPETEKDYHGGNSKAFYEVPFGKEGYLNMDKNPLYGIEIKDLMDNVIGKDPIIQNKILNVKNPIKEEFYNPNNVKIPYRRKDFKYGGIVKTLQNKQDNSQWLDKYK